jgi:beta-lactamase class A
MGVKHIRESYHRTKKKYQKKGISRWWLVGATVLLLVLAEVGGQMFYTDGAARFNTAIDGLDVSGLAAADVEELLRKTYEGQKVTVESLEGERLEFSLAELGASVEVSEQVTAAIEYSLGERFVPFSLFWPRNIEVRPRVELGISAREMVNAGVVVENGQLRVVPAQPGLEVGEGDEMGVDVCSDKLVLRTNQQCVVHCNIRVVEPEIATAAAEAVARRVEVALLGGVRFSYKDGQMAEASYYDVVSWLNFTPNVGDGTVDASVDTDRVRGFLERTSLAALNQGAKSGQVDLWNGVVTAQSGGAAGWGIDYQGIAARVSEIISGSGEGGNEVAVELAYVAPGTVYNRSYSDDLAGLVAELEYLYGDKKVAIVTLDLTGQGRDIYINPWRQFTAASTYKLFVGYSMLKSGLVPDCFEGMIINSENACAQDWLSEKGFENVEEEAHAIGASGVTQFRNGDMRTSAMDLANFLSRIYRGELPIDNGRLIGDMKVQRFRQGIPAGLGGNAVVADKVGFLWGLLHDAGIVYSKKGDYVQVILTDGYSWGTIAEIARKIYERM